MLSRKTTSKSTLIVVYCKKGIRAGIAKKTINNLGYTNVIAWGGVDEAPLNQIFKDNKMICNHIKKN